jgi:hypothetical protein
MLVSITFPLNICHCFITIFVAILTKLSFIVLLSFTSYFIPISMACCRNPNLGLATKAKTCIGADREWSPRVTFHALGSLGKCEGMNPHTPKWVLILGVGVPMDSWIFRGWFRNKKSLDWKVPYIIGKLLKLRCLKWACMTHLGI